jgi:endonuclease/exonuclease/phosphatase family metal-dependent hydrolase
VATLNLAHGRGLALSRAGLDREDIEANLNRVAAVVIREKPDVLAVQEADAASSWSGSFNHVDWLAGTAGYEHVHHGLHFEAGALGLKARYGTALLATQRLDHRASHRLPAGTWHSKGLVMAEVLLDGRPLVVTSVHLNSELPSARRKQVEGLVSILQDVGKPLVLMGDLNSQWRHDNDAVRLLASKLDLQTYEPDSDGMMTFRAALPRRRIDWILISPDLEFIDCHVWPDPVSDHLGVAATLRWRD